MSLALAGKPIDIEIRGIWQGCDADGWRLDVCVIACLPEGDKVEAQNTWDEVFETKDAVMNGFEDMLRSPKGVEFLNALMISAGYPTGYRPPKGESKP